MAKLFFSYQHADEQLRNMLEKHLAALKHQGFIEAWHDRRIDIGTELEGEIDKYLNEADIILLLVSADFIASHYCYEIEMKRAIERHEANEARVIPVILRPCDWHDTPFGKLLAAPKDGKAITSWANMDEAFLDVVRSIKELVRKQPTGQLASIVSPSHIAPAQGAEGILVDRPRSANLRTSKNFTVADRDQFLDDAFEFMAAFFENSLQELAARNGDLSQRFRKIDANSFTAVIYRNGDAMSRCKIRLGGMLGKGISYSHNDQAGDNSFNENMSVANDDQHIYLKPMGMALNIGKGDDRLTPQGAAEYYWSMLIAPLQR
jgi:TIR domain